MDDVNPCAPSLRKLSLSKEEEAKVFLVALLIMLSVKADMCRPRKCKGDLGIKAACSLGEKCQVPNKASGSVITSLCEPNVFTSQSQSQASVAQMEVGIDSSWYQTNTEAEKVMCERLVVANSHLVSVMAAFKISLHYYY